MESRAVVGQRYSSSMPMEVDRDALMVKVGCLENRGTEVIEEI